MSTHCATCGTPVGRRDARWCGHCGAPLTTRASSTRSGARDHQPSGRLQTALLAVGLTGALILAVLGAGELAPRIGSEAGDDRDVLLPQGADALRSDGAGGAGVSPGAADPYPVRWSRDLPQPAAGILLEEDQVLVALGDEIRSFDAFDGEPRWNTTLAGVETHAELVGVVDGRLVVRGHRGTVHVLATATGEIAWEREHGLQQVSVGSGTVVVATGREIQGLALGDGTRQWRHSGIQVLADGRPRDVVAALTPDALVGFDLVTGERRWHTPVDTTGQRLVQSASSVLLFDREGLQIFRGEDGELQSAADELGGAVRGTPRVVADGVVVASIGSELVGLTLDGVPAWRREFGSRMSLLDHEERVLAVSEAITVHGLDAATGRHVLRLTPSGWFGAVDVDASRVALAVYTPTRGRLVLHDRRGTDDGPGEPIG